MTYAAIRDLIDDGDLIAVRSRTRGFATLVRWVTRSPYTHLAVAIRILDGIFVAEMDGAKNVLVPLSQYADSPFDVYSCPVDRLTVKQIIAEKLRGKIGYDWGDIIRIGLYFLFDRPLPENEDGKLQCASLPVVIYKQAGWQPSLWLPSIPWPGAVVHALGVPHVLRNEP